MRKGTMVLEGADIEVQAVVQRAGWAGSGGDAKRLVQSGKVRVNGQVELRRSHRLHAGDRVRFEDEQIVIVGDDR